MKNEETMTQLDLFGGTGAPAAGSQAAPGVQAPTKNTGALEPPWVPRGRTDSGPLPGHRPGAPDIETPAATTGPPKQVAFAPTPRRRLPADGGVRGNRYDERSAAAAATITCDDSPRLPGCYVN